MAKNLNSKYNLIFSLILGIVLAVAVSVGATSIGTNIDVTGNITVAGNIAVNSSSATSTFVGGIAVETSGFVYDYSTNRVGIGTAAPDDKLVISGQEMDQGFTVENTQSATVAYPGFGIVNYSGSLTGHPFAFFKNAGGTKESPTILTNGEAGLFAFQAHTGTAFRDVVRFGAQTGPNFSESDQEGILYFKTGDGTTYTERMRIQPNGNVGIGTTTPWGLLSVLQTETAGVPAFVVADVANDTSPFIIDQTGIVGIGTSSPASNSSVVIDSSATTTLYISSQNGAKGGCIQLEGPASTTFRLIATTTGPAMFELGTCQ